MKKIFITDATLNTKNTFSFKEKIEIARQLENLNVDVIELPALQNVKSDTLLIRTISSFVKNAILSVAVGLNKKGVDDAVSALNNCDKKRLRIEVPVSTFGMEYSCHKKPDKMLALVEELVSYAKQYTNDVEFCALDATRAEQEFLQNIVSAAIKSGANTVTLCDTAAILMPDKFAEFTEKFAFLAEQGVALSVAVNNKYALATGSAVLAISGVANGVKLGVGGEEIPLEAFANIIKNCGESYGYSAAVKYTELSRIVGQIGRIIDNVKDDKKALPAGNTEEVGIRLDKHDTKNDVVAAAANLGYDLSSEDQARVYEEFLRVAEKKAVGVKELDAIIASVALQVEPTYKLVSYVINTGNIINASAQITVSKDGEEIQGISMGNGPVDAAFLAIEEVIGRHFELDDFQIQSVTEGKEAMGSAVVKLRADGRVYSGNGISTDILGASIRAYINAVNKIVYEEA